VSTEGGLQRMVMVRQAAKSHNHGVPFAKGLVKQTAHTLFFMFTQVHPTIAGRVLLCDASLAYAPGA